MTELLDVETSIGPLVPNYWDVRESFVEFSISSRDSDSGSYDKLTRGDEPRDLIEEIYDVLQSKEFNFARWKNRRIERENAPKVVFSSTGTVDATTSKRLLVTIVDKNGNYQQLVLPKTIVQDQCPRRGDTVLYEILENNKVLSHRLSRAIPTGLSESQQREIHRKGREIKRLWE
jgi:hypothetical protein